MAAGEWTDSEEGLGVEPRKGGGGGGGDGRG